MGAGCLAVLEAALALDALDDLAVGLDALLGNVLGDALGFLNGLGAQGNLLNRHGFLGHGHAVLVQGNGSLSLADLAVEVSAVSVGDRLAGDADLFALNRNLDGLGLVNDVLAQANLASLDALLANVELLLGTDQGAVLSNLSVCELAAVSLNVLASSVASACSCLAGLVVLSAGCVTCAVLGALETVVAVESLLVSVGEVAVLVQIRSVLDALLRESEVQVAIGQGVAAQRNDGLAGAEQAVVDGDEVRLAVVSLT